jgi:hypothetical protein
MPPRLIKLSCIATHLISKLASSKALNVGECPIVKLGALTTAISCPLQNRHLSVNFIS